MEKIAIRTEAIWGAGCEILLGNGTRCKLSKRIYLNINASYKGQTKDLGEIVCWVVDDNEWKELLIGKVTLAKFGLMPEQNLDVRTIVKVNRVQSLDTTSDSNSSLESQAKGKRQETVSTRSEVEPEKEEDRSTNGTAGTHASQMEHKNEKNISTDKNTKSEKETKSKKAVKATNANKKQLSSSYELSSRKTKNDLLTYSQFHPSEENMRECIVLVEVEHTAYIPEKDYTQLFKVVKSGLIAINLSLDMLYDAIKIAAAQEWILVETITDEMNQLVFFIFRKMNGKNWAPTWFSSQKVNDVTTRGINGVAEALKDLAPYVKTKLWLHADETGLITKDLLPEVAQVNRLVKTGNMKSDKEKAQQEILDEARDVQGLNMSEIAMLGEEINPKPIRFSNLKNDLNNVWEEYGYGENTEDDDQERETILENFNTKVEAAPELTQEQKKQLINLLTLRINAFGCESSKVQMSNLHPITVTLYPDAPGEIMANPICQGTQQREFIRNKLQGLEELGMVYQAKNPTYGSPAFAVDKKGPKRFRMVLDLRRLNKWTVKSPLAMPNLEEQVARCTKGKYFGSFDVLSGFDYLRTAKESQKYFTIVTMEKSYTMVGAPMGWCNTPMLFQNRIKNEVIDQSGISAEVEGLGVILWIDDILLYCTTFEQYLENLDKLLVAVIKKKVRLNVRKCDFYNTQAEWCGREISHGQWTFAEKYYKKILETAKPVYRHELAQVMYLANWLQQTIPGLAEIRDKFQKETSLDGKNLKALERKNIKIEWTAELSCAWKELLRLVSVASQKNLKNYNPEEALMLFTDASKTHWSMIVMQGPYEDLRKKNPLELPVKPLMFLSGKFKKSEINWHVSQKELYPIIYAFKRVSWLLTGHPGFIAVYTDHKNLKHLLMPETEANMCHLERLRRWALQMQQAEVWVTHIKGTDNFFADLLTRWAVPEEERKQEKQVTVRRAKLYKVSRTVAKKRKHSDLEPEDPEGDLTEKALEERKKLLDSLNWFDTHRVSPLSPFNNKEWKPLELDEIERENRRLQRKTLEKRGKAELICVPETLVEKFLVHNHLVNVHGPLKSELEQLKDYKLELPEGITVKDMVQTLRRKCLHCQRTPNMIRRPLRLTKLATEPGQILHSDFLYVNKKGYIVTLVDSLSRKTMLHYSENANAMAVVEILMKWNAAFELKDNFVLVSDNGSHYVNQVLDLAKIHLRFQQSFTVAYAPWTNGSGEAINSLVLRIIKTLTSELGLEQHQWPRILEDVTSVINTRRMPRRLNMTPNEIFLGLEPKKRALVQTETQLERLKLAYNPKNLENYVSKVNELNEQVQMCFEKVYDQVKYIRERENIINSKKMTCKNGINLSMLQYGIGDWVMLSNSNTKRATQKMKPLYSGPFQIVEVISDNVYRIENIKGDFSRKVHASFLWFYEPSGFVPGNDVLMAFQHDWAMLEVEMFKDNQKKKGEWQLKAVWLGFDESFDSWEPLANMVEDVPDLVEEYIFSMKDSQRKKLLEKEYNRLRKKQLKKVNRVDYPDQVNKGWTSQEEFILAQCVLKYGCGEYEKIISENHLPGKSKQQMYTKLQRMLGTQAIQQYHGLRIDIYEVAEFNLKHSDLPMDDLDSVRVRNEIMFAKINNEPPENISIPSYKRASGLKWELEWLKDVKEGKRIATEHEVQLIEEVVATKKRKLKMNVTSTFSVAKDLFAELSKVDQTRDDHRFQHNQRKDCYVKYVNTNTFVLEHGPFEATYWFRPRDSTSITTDILTTSQEFDFEVLIVDPPWETSGTKNPVRGPRIAYETVGIDKLTNIKLTQFQKKGYIFLWITNASRVRAIKWLIENNYELLQEIKWIKTTVNKKIAQSTGRYARHGTEGCLVARKNTQVEMDLPKTFRSRRRVQSQKPMDLHVLAEKWYPEAPKGELFGRHHNLRDGWTTIGKEVDPPSRIWHELPGQKKNMYVKRQHMEEQLTSVKDLQQKQVNKVNLVRLKQSEQ